MFDCTINTDASWCHQTSAAGGAVWISYEAGPYRTSFRFKQRPKDPSEAEYWTIINGLYLARKLGHETILVNSDSMNAMKRLKAEGGPLIDNVEFRHVKAHTKVRDARSYVNRWADREAKKIMRVWRAELKSNHKEDTNHGSKETTNGKKESQQKENQQQENGRPDEKGETEKSQSPKTSTP